MDSLCFYRLRKANVLLREAAVAVLLLLCLVALLIALGIRRITIHLGYS